MAVSWVGGTTTVAQFSGSTITASAPAGLADGDLLFAFVYAGAAPTAPSGWTRRDTTPSFTTGSITRHLRCFQKDSVTSADASASFVFGVSSVSGITYAAARGAGSIEVSHATVDSTVTLNVTPPALTAAADGELFLVAGATIIQPTASFPQVAVPSGFTKWSGSPSANYRVAGGRAAFNTGASNSGSFLMDDGANSSANGLAAITVRLINPSPSSVVSAAGPLGEVLAAAKFGTEVAGKVTAETPLGAALVTSHARPVAVVSAAGPLAAPSALAHHLFSRALASGPLGTAALLARVTPAGLSSSPGPLSTSGLTVAFHDFTAQLEAAGAVTFYVCDLVDGAVVTRVPISSWQGTLQTAGSAYLQAVIPAVASLAETIAGLSLLAEFVIYRGARLPDGATIEQEMARSLVETVQFDRGPQRYTCTISGYSDAIAPPTTAEPATDRTLRGVRSISSGEGNIRVRCSIDWFLRPGQVAIVEGVPFVASYLNYYALARESYMDVGETAV